MKSLLFKRALRQTFGIKKGWGTVGLPIPVSESEEEQ